VGGHLLGGSTNLGRQQLLEVTDGVIGFTFHSDFLAETVVASIHVSSES
jgi:hypothetical protein